MGRLSHANHTDDWGRREYLRRRITRSALLHHLPDRAQDLLRYHYEEVVSTHSAPGGDAFCLEVPDGHRFLQNGFDGWNSQGSQWRRVLVKDESGCFRGQEKRWAYTSVTRAERKVTVVR